MSDRESALPSAAEPDRHGAAIRWQGMPQGRLTPSSLATSRGLLGSLPQITHLAFQRGQYDAAGTVYECARVSTQCGYKHRLAFAALELVLVAMSPLQEVQNTMPFLDGILDEARYGFRVVSERAVLRGHPGAVSLDFLRYERTRKSRDRGEDAPERSLGEAAARNAIRTKNPQWC